MPKAANKHAIIMALWYEELNYSAICPYNHDLYYVNGWFKMGDDVSVRMPEILEKAEALIAKGCDGYFEHYGMRDIPRIKYPEEDTWE